MQTTLFSITLMMATLFTTMVTGLLFCFAIVVMPGIKNLTDREFIRGFQEMDGIIQNNHPLFVLVWVGSILLLLIAMILGISQLEGLSRLLLIASTLIYIGGVQVPTIVINVPLNNRLQAVDVHSMNEPQHAAARSDFEPQWNKWNQIRTVLATVVSLMLIVLLLML